MPLAACKYGLPLNNTGPGIRNTVEVASRLEKTRINAEREQNVYTLKTARYGRTQGNGQQISVYPPYQMTFTARAPPPEGHCFPSQESTGEARSSYSSFVITSK